MSILIRDMEMPTSCAVCDWGSYVGNGRAMCSKTSMTEKTDIMSNRRPDWCPLIEIEFNEEQFNTVQNILLKR